MQAEACPSHVPTYTNLSPGFRNLPSTAKSSSGLQSTQNHHQQDLGNIWKRSDRLEQQLVIGPHWKLDIVGKVLFHHYSFIMLIADLFWIFFFKCGVFAFRGVSCLVLICSDLLLNYNPALIFHSSQVVADNTYIFMHVPVIATFSSQNNNNNNKNSSYQYCLAFLRGSFSPFSYHLCSSEEQSP